MNIYSPTKHQLQILNNINDHVKSTAYDRYTLLLAERRNKPKETLSQNDQQLLKNLGIH